MRKTGLRSYKTPRYPTREEFIANPQFLQDHLPRSWKNNKFIFGVLTFFVSCGLHKAEASAAGQEIAGGSGDLEGEKGPLHKVGAVQPVEIKIAPLFIHGEGYGAVGCVVVSPPVFLNEEEARRIIAAELEKEKVVFNKNDVRQEEIFFRDSISGKEHLLAMDGLDSKHNLGYEYVSESDYFRLGGKRSDSTVQEFDIRTIAMAVRNKLEKKARVNAGVFYDPVESPDLSEADSWEKYQAAVTLAKQKAQEKLRAQVQEFITWIRKEGLVK